MKTGVLQIGEWRFDPTDGSLSRRDSERRLDPRVVDLFVLLIERRGELVDKDTILRSVWKDTVVAADAVTVAIYELRKALDDDARNPRYVETVPKRGYRLRADVSPAAPPWLRRARAARLGSWATAALVAAALATVVWRSLPSAALPSTVIAVLPFDGRSDEADDYLASGIADTLTTELTRVKGLSVLAHHSAREIASPSDPVLDELDVSYLVSGSVYRQHDRLRINAHLSSVHEPTYIWSQTYEGDMSSMLRLQRQIAVSITSQLSHELSAEVSPSGREIPSQAMQAYLLGRFFWNERDPESLRKSVGFFTEALDADPHFARAWAGLADAYTFPGPTHLGLSHEEGYRLALRASRKAQELAPELAEAYVSSGAIRFAYEWNLPQARRDFENALTLAPSLVLAHQWYAELLSACGEHDKSIAHMREAARLDPHSVAVRFDLFWVQYMAGDYADAVDTLDATIRLDARGGDPEPLLFWSKARVQARLDRMDDAVGSIASFYEAAGGELPPEAQALMSDPSLDGFRRFRVEALQSEVERGRPYALSLAGAYAEAGRNEIALDWLERAAVEKDAALLWIAVSPDLVNLRQERRFLDLVRTIGLSPESS